MTAKVADVGQVIENIARDDVAEESRLDRRAEGYRDTWAPSVATSLEPCPEALLRASPATPRPDAIAATAARSSRAMLV